MTGDGELQEGLIWEAVMYSAHKRLDNLCVLVDRNNGQLDIVDRLILPLPDLEAVFRAFGWQVRERGRDQYAASAPRWKSSSTASATASPRRSCAAPQGTRRLFGFPQPPQGGDSGDALMEQELALQAELRRRASEAFAGFLRPA